MDHVVLGPRQARQIASLEKIMKRAARFMTGNYSLTPGNTTKFLGWVPLVERSARIKLTTLHKANSEIIEIPLVDLTPYGRARRQNTGNFPIP